MNPPMRHGQKSAKKWALFLTNLLDNAKPQRILSAMRTNYTLWRAQNGWLLVPEGNSDKAISAKDVAECVVFKTLDEFAKFSPKRVRKSRATPKNKQVTTKEPEHANIT